MADNNEQVILNNVSLKLGNEDISIKPNTATFTSGSPTAKQETYTVAGQVKGAYVSDLETGTISIKVEVLSSINMVTLINGFKANPGKFSMTLTDIVSGQILAAGDQCSIPDATEFKVGTPAYFSLTVESKTNLYEMVRYSPQA